MNIFKRKKEEPVLPREAELVDAKAIFTVTQNSVTTTYTLTEEGSYFIHNETVCVRDALQHLKSRIQQSGHFVVMDNDIMIPALNIDKVELTTSKRTVKVEK